MDETKQRSAAFEPKAFDMEGYIESERRFWSCPVTGRDCRTEPRPAIGLDMRTGQCRIYASAAVAAPTLRVIEIVPGVSADYLLDNWQHFAMKVWIDPASLNHMMRRVAWQFGSLSWAGRMCDDDPSASGVPRRAPSPAKKSASNRFSSRRKDS
jgi:hypothetical protein